MLLQKKDFKYINTFFKKIYITLHNTAGGVILILDKVDFKNTTTTRDTEEYLLISQFIKNINI